MLRLLLALESDFVPDLSKSHYDVHNKGMCMIWQEALEIALSWRILQGNANYYAFLTTASGIPARKVV